MAAWTGFTSDVLRSVKQAITAEKVSLGLKEVRIGEKYRGWVTPACFIYTDPQGTTPKRESGRHGVADYEVPVRVIVLTKKMTESDDENVFVILEGILDVLEAAAPAMGGAHNMKVVNAGRVLPMFSDSNQEYQTVGSVQLLYQKDIARPR